MHKFPDDFNQKSRQKTSQKNQNDSLCRCRQYIYDSATINSKYGYDNMYITIPDDLERQHSLTLCEEILERFDSLDVKFSSIEDVMYGLGLGLLRRTFSNIEELKKFMSQPAYKNNYLIIYQIRFYY